MGASPDGETGSTSLRSPEPASGFGPSGNDPARGFAPCPLCKQYSHSIGDDQLAAAHMHFETMFSHRGDGFPTQHVFDQQTRDMAQRLMTAARERADPFAAAILLAGTADPNVAGELLRDLSFTEKYGCYSCFDLVDSFEAIDGADVPLAARTAMLGCFAETPECFGEIDAFRHKNLPLVVAWHWDGDGTLVFLTPTALLFNGDCKKDYEWERHQAGDWIDDYVRGRTPFDCCQCGACVECDARARRNSRDSDGARSAETAGGGKGGGDE